MARRLLPCALLGVVVMVAGCADAPPNLEAQPSPQAAAQSWVTTDRAAADALRDEMPGLAQGVHEQASGLVALELPRDQLPAVSEVLHRRLSRCPGFMLEDSWEAASAEARPSTPRALQVAYSIDNAATVTALLEPIGESTLRDTIQKLVDFRTRMHDTETGKQASLWVRDRWQGYAEPRADAKVELINHEGTPQPSVALTIRGRKYPDELVVLGGHLDSINQNGGPAPGADDNASGIAVLDDVARAALSLGYQPDRTVIFYAYAAEEIGLVGSAEIAKAAADAALDVVAVLQLDMTNFHSAPEPYVAIITDYTDPALNQLSRLLIDEYVGVPWKESECGYACSDHASWTKRGFPANHVHESISEESNKRIHTAQDTLALSNGSAANSVYFARYAAAFMAEIAKGSLPSVGVGGTGGSGGGAAGAGGAGGAVPVAEGGTVGGGGLPTSAGGGGGGEGVNGGVAGTGTSAGGGAGSAHGGTAGGVPAAGSPSASVKAEPASVADDSASCSCRLAGPPSQRLAGGLWLLAVAAFAGARRWPRRR